VGGTQFKSWDRLAVVLTDGFVVFLAHCENNVVQFAVSHNL